MNEDFVPDLTPVERLNVYTTQAPWAKKALSDKVSKAAWKTKPSWVIIDTQDRMVNQICNANRPRKSRPPRLSSKVVTYRSYPTPRRYRTLSLGDPQIIQPGQQAVSRSPHCPLQGKRSVAGEWINTSGKELNLNSRGAYSHAEGRPRQERFCESSFYKNLFAFFYFKVEGGTNYAL
jgi:hypothetical protein